MLIWIYFVLSLLLPSCDGRTEDSSPMYWDASECGNGEGTDFVHMGDVILYADGTVKVVR